MKEDNVVEGTDEVVTFYMKEEKVKLAGKEYVVGYDFNADNQIAYLVYNTDEATLEEAQEYVDSIYGELEKTEDGGYIITCDGKSWVVSCLLNGKTRILIQRDTTLD